ncbi:ankyrin repeat domain-containing protein [Clostridium sp. C8-1-8]|uniref:ankyrin repeat domain-containing protein n=1 Tax=Clostridium sp. C8-1-8 TaxID=2698831 RepID=UPI00136865B7|nr:ankyrin repeat domain-containing protein [Clostridium sp. C8-1-8]
MKENKEQQENAKKMLILISKGDIVGIKALLDIGVDVDIRDSYRRTPLMNAVMSNKIEIVKLLISLGADVNLRDIDGRSTLHFAAQNYSIEAANILLKHNSIVVDIVDDHGNTPLSDAVFYSKGRGEIIKLFLEFGADKNLQNNYGISPIGLAGTIANYDIKQFFI